MAADTARVLTGIDHVIVACRDPDAAARAIESALGLRAAGGGRHDAHGTFNRLFWLGDSYLELMGIFDADVARTSWWGAHMLRLVSGAEAAYAGLALASDDLTADVARLRGRGSPISDPIAGERLRADDELVRWAIGRLPAPDPELGLVFLIEHDTGAAEWRPADRTARAAEVHPFGGPARLLRVELPAGDVGASTLRLLRALGLQFRPSLGGGGARDSSIGVQTLRLRRGGQPTIVIGGGTAPVAQDVLGCRWEIRPAG